jgi:hypothetical protein
LLYCRPGVSALNRQTEKRDTHAVHDTGHGTVDAQRSDGDTEDDLRSSAPAAWLDGSTYTDERDGEEHPCARSLRVRLERVPAVLTVLDREVHPKETTETE